jgi:hypothetical protein
LDNPDRAVHPAGGIVGIGGVGLRCRTIKVVDDVSEGMHVLEAADVAADMAAWEICHLLLLVVTTPSRAMIENDRHCDSAQ